MTKNSDDGGYDRLASVYPLLEMTMFGSGLTRARHQACDAILRQAETANEILIVGDGRGQMLRKTLHRRPACRITSMDRSGRMLQHQRRRVRARDADRVRYLHQDIRQPWSTDRRFDLAMLPFVVDCFSPDDLIVCLDQVRRSIRPGGVIAYVDFAPPKRKIDRLRNFLMHRFFALATDLPNRNLVDHDSFFRSACLVPVSSERFLSGFVVTRCYRVGVEP